MSLAHPAVIAAALFGLSVAVAADKKEGAPTVSLTGNHPDESLQKAAPTNHVIVSAKAWEALATAWGIKDAPKVDFTKELLVVATTTGSRLNLAPELTAAGNLVVAPLSTRDLRPGFRYAIRSVPRAGVKTVNGMKLPEE